MPILVPLAYILLSFVYLAVSPFWSSSTLFRRNVRVITFHPSLVAPAPQPEPGPHPSVPEDNDVIITSSDKGAEGGSTEKPVVIVSDEEEEERQGVQGEDLEIIGAFSGMFSNTNIQ